MIDLELKYGRKDILDMLDEVRERVTNGDVEAVIAIEFYSNDERNIGNNVAWKDDMAFPWSRMVAAAGSLTHELYSEGLQEA
jgi:hypothetical protein